MNVRNTKTGVVHAGRWEPDPGEWVPVCNGQWNRHQRDTEDKVTCKRKPCAKTSTDPEWGFLHYAYESRSCMGGRNDTPNWDRVTCPQCLKSRPVENEHQENDDMTTKQDQRVKGFLSFLAQGLGIGAGKYARKLVAEELHESIISGGFHHIIQKERARRRQETPDQKTDVRQPESDNPAGAASVPNIREKLEGIMSEAGFSEEKSAPPFQVPESHDVFASRPDLVKHLLEMSWNVNQALEHAEALHDAVREMQKSGEIDACWVHPGSNLSSVFSSWSVTSLCLMSEMISGVIRTLPLLSLREAYDEIDDVV